MGPGDHIRIIAPGSHSPIENLIKGVEVLRSWGFKVSYRDDLLDPKIFLANSDEKRFSALKEALTMPDVKAIWCLRGGYGAIRLLPHLEKIKTPRQMKLLIGLSDVSSLHALINKKWGWPSLHASLLDRLALRQLSETNEIELKNTLTDSQYKTIFTGLEPLNKAGAASRHIKSNVVGGNLMVITSTLGTPSQIDCDGKILFLEEISERAYRVDRCLQQLRQAGVLNRAKAVVFGDFKNCDEPNKENYIRETLFAFFQKLNVPAFTGVESGHGDLQRPLFFNTETHLTCGKKPQMIVYSPFDDL